MNDQERQVIADIFRRLEQVANQPRDPEAEAYIAECVRRQPYAPYAMAQAVFVQEQALAKLQADNEALRAELEAERRGLYTGAFGYLAHDGSLELGMVIRTLTVCDGQGHYFAGGGIVADSDPDREVQETLWKAEALLGLLAKN